jgi:hypothetical protein
LVKSNALDRASVHIVGSLTSKLPSINFDGKHPSASDIIINLMTSLVTKSHGSEIKKASEFFRLGLFDLLSILSQDFLGDN